MAPIPLSFATVFEFFMSLGPIFIASFLIIGSAFNQNVKGFVYLGGLLITMILTIGFKQLFKHQRNMTTYRNNNCEKFVLPELITQYSTPDLNTMLLTFTAAYLLWPMFKGEAHLNPLLVILLLVFIIGNGITRVLKTCSGVIDILVGVFLGFGCGTGWFFLFWMTNNKKLLYIDDLVSNKVACSRPTKQNFKCAVYKNGELVKNL